MNGHFFTSALRDGLRPGRMIAWAVVALVILVIALVWKNLAKTLTPLEAYGQVVNIVVFRMLALAAAVTSMTVVTQEVSQKTIIYLLTRPQPRVWIMIARLLAAAVTATIIAWMSLFAVGLAILGPSAMASSSAFRTDMLILAVGALAYVSFFTFISLIINRALIICLLFAFGWETFVQSMPGGMSLLSVAGYVSKVADHPVIASKDAGAIVEAAAGPGAGTSWIVLLAIGILMAAASALWFQNNEYVAREDAE